MFTEDERIKDLLELYNAGIISTDEFVTMKNGIDRMSDKELQELLFSRWENFNDDSEIPSQKKDRIYDNIIRQIGSRQKKRRNVFLFTGMYRKTLRFAAAILVLISVSWAVKLHIENRKMCQIAEQNITIQSGKSGSSSVTLPDGTHVLLNANSALTYRQDFGLKDRHVALSGEGYFEVAHDSSRKFVVKTGYMDITVLGTKFNVYAYESHDIVEMVLLEGSVQVNTENPPFQNFTVKPNEKVTYNKVTGDFSLHRTDHKIETAWMDKTLVFRGNRLKDVFSILERKFGINITLDNDSILEDIYSGTFDDDNVESILNVLKIHYSFEYRTEGNDIYVKTRPYRN